MLFRCFEGCVLGSLDARPCCFPVLKEALLGSLSSQKSWRLRFGKPCLFYRFRPQRLTLKITSAQVSEVSPAAAQIVSFLAVPAATFDIEDHPSTGQKTSFLSSPGHAVSLFWRLRFGKPWRQAMLFPCPEGSVVGKSFQSEVEARLKAKSRCEMRPEVSPEAAKIVSFLKVPAATFDTEDHPSTGQKTSFLSSPGHAVALFWRLRFGKPCLFYRFRPQRLTLKITPAQVSEVSPAAAQIVSFLAVPAATFDTEDHPSTGQKTSFLSSPGHAALLFWRLRFGKPWRQAMLFPCPEGSVVGKSFQSEVEVHLKAKSRCEIRPEVGLEAAKIVSFLKVPAARFDTEDHPSTGQKTSFLSSPGLSFGKPWRSEVEVHLKAKSRCEIRPGASPEAAKIVFFIGSGRSVWHWRSPQHRSKNELLELARPCCFAVLKAAFWEALTPGHAVSLSRRKRCWEVFPVRSRGASQS